MRASPLMICLALLRRTLGPSLGARVAHRGSRRSEVRLCHHRDGNLRGKIANSVVTSQIIRPEGAPIEVDWRLGISDGVYKIKDVAIDGVSMALAQRSAISQLIAREGGQVGMLLATMRQ